MLIKRSLTVCFVLYFFMQSRPMSAGNMSSVGGGPGSGYHHGHHHHHHHHQTDDAQSSRSGDTPGPHGHSNLNSYPNCDHNSDGGMSILSCLLCPDIKWPTTSPPYLSQTIINFDAFLYTTQWTFTYQMHV